MDDLHPASSHRAVQSFAHLPGGRKEMHPDFHFPYVPVTEMDAKVVGNPFVTGYSKHLMISPFFLLT